MAVLLNASNDDFIRTTEKRHHEAVKNIWSAWARRATSTRTAVPAGTRCATKPITRKARPNVRADGVRYGPQGVAGRVGRGEASYFFKLSAYQDKLLKHYEDNPDFIGPAERRNEVTPSLNPASRTSPCRARHSTGAFRFRTTRAMSCMSGSMRSTNYITGDRLSRPIRKGRAAKYWPANIHMIGKDIIRFHAVYWPRLPDVGGPAVAEEGVRARLPAQQGREDVEVARQRRRSRSIWSNVSASTRSAISSCAKSPSARTAAIARRESRPASIPTSPTASATSPAVRLSMIVKNCDGKIPECRTVDRQRTRRCSAAADALHASTRDDMNPLMIHRALTSIIAVVSEADRYFAGQEPWALKKTDRGAHGNRALRHGGCRAPDRHPRCSPSCRSRRESCSTSSPLPDTPSAISRLSAKRDVWSQERLWRRRSRCSRAMSRRSVRTT